MIVVVCVVAIVVYSVDISAVETEVSVEVVLTVRVERVLTVV